MHVWPLECLLSLRERSIDEEEALMATIAAVIKRKPRGLAALLGIRNVRHLSQFFFFAFIAYLAIQQVLVGEGGATVVSSPEAYCPFGGVETLYKFVSSGGQTINHTHLSNVIILIATLASALVFRSAFCSWICPFGTLQEAITGFSSWLQRRIPPLKKAVKTLKANAGPLAKLDGYLRYLKYVVLAWIVVATVVAGVMVFRDYDPYATLLTITEASLGPGLIILLIVVIASFFVERPWCRYACPLGAINGIVSQVSPFRLERNELLCKGCAICNTSCPVNLPVATSKKITSPECIGCLECVDVCPRGGALELKLGLPFGK
jgi:polyferredoxin